MRRVLRLLCGGVLLWTAQAAEGKEGGAAHIPAGVLHVTTGLAELPDGKLYYESVGAGPAVVLIHSGGFDRRMWDDQFMAFAHRGQVIRFDARGAGKSPMARAQYLNAEDLYGLLRFLYVRKAALIGVSLGGKIAIDFALAHPDMVTALIPVATGVSGYEFSDEFMDRYRAVASAAHVQGAARAAPLWLDDPLFHVARKDPAVYQKLLRIAEANGESWQNGPLADSRPPALARLAAIHAPTLVIVGSEDINEIRELADVVVRTVPGANKVVMPGADHALNMEQPTEFNRIVLDFLRPHQSAGP